MHCSLFIQTWFQNRRTKFRKVRGSDGLRRQDTWSAEHAGVTRVLSNIDGGINGLPKDWVLTLYKLLSKSWEARARLERWIYYGFSRWNIPVSDKFKGFIRRFFSSIFLDEKSSLSTISDPHNLSIPRFKQKFIFHPNC